MEAKSTVIDTRKLFLFNLHHFVKYLFTGEVLPVLLLLSSVFILIPINILFFIFINLITIPMVYKFAFDVLADTARGNMAPTVRQNYLVSNVIVIKVAIVALLTEGLHFWLLSQKVESSYVMAYIVFSTFLIPAIYMILALTNSLLAALNPMILFKLIKTALISYALFVGFWVLSQLVYEFVLNPFLFHYLPSFIDGMVSSFVKYALLILNFHIMGYIIFQNRNEIDLEGIGFDRVDDDQIIIEVDPINPVYERIKNIMDDAPQQALSMVLELQKEGDHSAELQQLYHRALKRKLYSPNNVEFAKMIHDRITKKQLKRAYDDVVERLGADKDYVEEKPEDIRLLIEHAIEVNKKQYIPHLLKDFHLKYPYHADIVPNYFSLAKILYDDRNSRDKSRELLQSLVAKYPRDKYIAEVKAWLQGVDLIAKK
ncbi:MAG TPA: hypothetical protein ENJ41_07135 [Oceanospirillales bacterium]|nr:hypothetical protein [Oceanospirillales bacterium]